jgi:thioredoxin-dependent peroxiredoxin
VVLYFYPAAMTGGCTKQACSYRNHVNQGENTDIEIVGISGDSPGSLKVFQQANQLNFTLLSDPDGAIAKKYGVPVKQGQKSITRTVDGKEVVLERSNTAARWTFIVDRKGRLVYKDMKVKAAQDLENVLEFIKKAEA